MSNQDNKDNLIEEELLRKEIEPDKKREILTDEEREAQFERLKLKEMSEDEAILTIEEEARANDKVIASEYLSSMIEQDDTLIYFEVDNIYKNNKNLDFRSRRSMRKDPPVLTIQDDANNLASFYLTEKLNDELIAILKQVDRAYLGFGEPKKEDVPDKLIDKIGYYARNNPIKVIIPLILIVVWIVVVATSK